MKTSSTPPTISFLRENLGWLFACPVAIVCVTPLATVEEMTGLGSAGSLGVCGELDEACVGTVGVVDTVV